MKLSEVLVKGMLLVFAAGVSLGYPHSVRAADTALSEAAVRDMDTEGEPEHIGQEDRQPVSGYDLAGEKISLKAVSDSGACGDSLQWAYDSNTFSLTVSGTGSMYSYPNGAPWYKYADEIRTLTIQEGIISIGEAAFYGLSGVKEVTLPASLRTMETAAFADCRGLTSITLPQGMEQVPDWAFDSCTSLAAVNFPAGLKKIGMGAFFYCSALDGVAFPKGLISIEEDAFWGTAITRAEIPDSVTSIGKDAFPSTATLILPSGLAEMEDGTYRVVQVVPVQSKLLYSSAFEILTLVNKERKTQGLSALSMDKTLLDAAMLRAQELGIYFSHTRPTGADCYSAASNLHGENIAAGYGSAASVMAGWMSSPGHRANILTDGYTGIGIGAALIDGTYYWVQCFSRDDAQKVSESSCKDRTNVEKIKLSLDNKDLEYGADLSTASIKVQETASIGLYFYNGFMPTVVLPEYLAYRSSDTSICIVSQGKITGTGAGTAKITVSIKDSPEISMTKSLKVSGTAGSASKKPVVGTKLTDKKSKGSFKVTKAGSTVAYTGTTDKKAASVTIPSTIKSGGVTYKVTSIANNAFKNNKKLKKVTISGNVTSIGSNAFSGCTVLTQITIPAKVSKIGSKAFYNCKKLMSLTIKSQKLTTKNVAANAFAKVGSSNYRKAKVTVPAKKYTEYKKLLKKKGLSSKIKVKKK